MTAPAQAAAEVALARQYNAQAARLRDSLAALMARLWASLRGDYNRASEDRFVAQAVPASVGAQRAMSALTSAYLARLVAAMTGTPPRPSAVPQSQVTGEALRGVDPAVVYRRPLEQARYALSQGKGPVRAGEVGLRRAQSIAGTDAQLAKTHTARRVMAADGRIVGYRRVLTGAESCGLCVVASSLRYHVKDLMPIHPGCVPEGTRVSAGDVVAVTRRRYAGELAVLTAASGDQVTVTANHPVLTDHGWVPGHLVREGDYIVRGRSGHRAVDGGPYEGKSPALIEDVWRAASVAGFVRMPLAAEDFHGDGTDSEVDVVWTDGNLAPVGDVTFRQPRGERALMDGQFGRPFFSGGGVPAPLVPGGLTANIGGMGRRQLAGSLLRGHLCGPHQASLGAVADVDLVVPEQGSDRVALDPVFLGQGVFGGTADVFADDFLGWEGAPGAAPRRFDAPAAEFPGEGRDSHARIGRRLLERLAGQVDMDRVVEVLRVDSTSRHVYNLHTAEGWYSAENHIVSNCDCGMSVIVGRGDPGLTINTAQVAEGAHAVGETRGGVKVYRPGDTLDLGDLLEPVHAAIEDRFGTSFRDAREIDYRKVITVHRHSELGPVLSVTGHRFTKKQIESGDLSAKK